MGYLRERMEKDIDLKGFSPETKRRYLICARDFVAFNRRSPELLGEEDIRAFLTYLIEVKKVKPATHHIYVAALKFFYRTTLGRPEEVASIAWPKVPKTLPDILSGREVEQLFDAVRSIKYRTILMTAYGHGLRVTESCCLKIDDIDSKRMLLHVQGKGHKESIRDAQRTRIKGASLLLQVRSASRSLSIPRKKHIHAPQPPHHPACHQKGCQEVWDPQTDFSALFATRICHASIGARGGYSHDSTPSRARLHPKHHALHLRDGEALGTDPKSPRCAGNA